MTRFLPLPVVTSTPVLPSAPPHPTQSMFTATLYMFCNASMGGAH